MKPAASGGCLQADDGSLSFSIKAYILVRKFPDQLAICDPDSQTPLKVLGSLRAQGGIKTVTTRDGGVKEVRGTMEYQEQAAAVNIPSPDTGVTFINEGQMIIRFKQDAHK